jgi:hypothetical protein
MELDITGMNIASASIAPGRAARPSRLMHRILAAFREEIVQAELPDDLVRWVETHFAQEERDAALACLRAAITHTGEPAGARILRCAAVASNGDLERLRRQIEQLRHDFRDVIMAGEYSLRDKRLVRARDLSKPIADS